MKVNNRKVLDGLMDAVGIEPNPNTRVTILRALDKYDRLGQKGVRELLGAGRKDESGDYTKGAGLTDEQIQRIIWFLVLRRRAVGNRGGNEEDILIRELSWPRKATRSHMKLTF